MLVPRMKRLLRTAGFEHIQKKAYIIEAGPDVEGYDLWMEDVQITSQSLKPVWVKMGITTEEEFEATYRAAYLDMLADDFSSIAYHATLWGTKGEKSEPEQAKEGQPE